MVDVANVMGSVPDGWWRDRAGAARRLHQAVSTAVEAGRLTYDRVVLVLEGRARSGVDAGIAGKVETVHAAGSGDDEIVNCCEALTVAGPAVVVTVATADRGLMSRVTPLGVEVVGPRSVPRRLDR